MASNLFTPILNDRTRAPHFFNGRLLSGEALTDEQRANHVARELLAQAVGDGVAYGLEVSSPTLGTATDRPVVTVTSGVAINRRGEILLLAQETEVQLVRPAKEAAAPATIFRTCTPVSSGTYVADAGVYLLTMSSIQAGNGLANVSGLGDTAASCNVKYIVDAVELRLMELPVSESALSDANRLRNRVAYECFGVGYLGDFVRDPLAPPQEPFTPLQQLRSRSLLTDCDVPLAVLYWTAAGGVRFVDLWPVRRRIHHTGATLPPWDDAAVARTEAMVLQFQKHIADLAGSGGVSTLVARDVFDYLPPIGFVPDTGGAAGGVVYARLFLNTTHLPPAHIEGARLGRLMFEALRYPPIRVNDRELIRLYLVRENRQAFNAGTNRRPTLLFTNGHIPDHSDPHFDLAYWNYANFA